MHGREVNPFERSFAAQAPSPEPEEAGGDSAFRFDSSIPPIREHPHEETGDGDNDGEAVAQRDVAADGVRLGRLASPSRDVALPHIPPAEVIKKIQRHVDRSPKPSLPGLKVISPSLNLPSDAERFRNWAALAEKWAAPSPGGLSPGSMLKRLSADFSPLGTTVAVSASTAAAGTSTEASANSKPARQGPPKSFTSSLLQIASQIPTPTPIYSSLRNGKGSSSSARSTLPALTPGISSLMDLPPPPTTTASIITTTSSAHLAAPPSDAPSTSPPPSTSQPMRISPPRDSSPPQSAGASRPSEDVVLPSQGVSQVTPPASASLPMQRPAPLAPFVPTSEAAASWAPSPPHTALDVTPSAPMPRSAGLVASAAMPCDGSSVQNSPAVGWPAGYGSDSGRRVPAPITVPSAGSVPLGLPSAAAASTHVVPPTVASQGMPMSQQMAIAQYPPHQYAMQQGAAPYTASTPLSPAYPAQSCDSPLLPPGTPAYNQLGPALPTDITRLQAENMPVLPPQKKGNTKRKVDYEALDDKRKQFLERNRQAAMKCRQRKKQQLALMETKTEGFRIHNAQLEQQIAIFQDELARLRDALTLVNPGCCAAPPPETPTVAAHPSAPPCSSVQAATALAGMADPSAQIMQGHSAAHYGQHAHLQATTAVAQLPPQQTQHHAGWATEHHSAHQHSAGMYDNTHAGVGHAGYYMAHSAQNHPHARGPPGQAVSMQVTG